MYGSSNVWKIKEKDLNEVLELSTKCKISKLTAKVLLNRGVCTYDMVKKFMRTHIDDLHDPFLFLGMSNAVDTIRKAIDEKQKITIYGDYDADGVTSVSVLYMFLMEEGALVDYYVPDRLEEGYGLNEEAIQKIVDKGTKLLITVDCGIRSIDEVRKAMEIGMEVIITDHHAPGKLIPECKAVLNPKIVENTYPYTELAGVGVVFKLIQALQGDKKYTGYLDIVALGTIADIVPIIDENRIIVKHGLKMLNETKNIGLRALIEKTGLLGKDISTRHLGYVLAPRLNAAGRLGNASQSVELLITRDIERAEQIADYLYEENKNRQKIELEIMKSADGFLEANPELTKSKVIILHSRDWHSGVIGIVASRIMTKYNKPCILIGIDDDGIGKGSGRSIPGFNMIKALECCSDTLIKFGGHELAAGISIKSDDIEKFRQMMSIVAEEQIDIKSLTPVIFYDEDIENSDLCIDTINELEKLEPFGVNNPEPKFVYTGIQVDNYRAVGKDNKHVKIQFKEDKKINGIAFNFGQNYHMLNSSFRSNILCTMERDTWNGGNKIVLNIKDIKPYYNKEFAECLVGQFFHNISEGFINNLTRGVNCHSISTLKTFISESVDKNDKTKDLLKILSSGQRNLILINTTSSIPGIIDNIYKNRLDGDTVIYFTKPHLDTNEINSIIINADIDEIEYNIYDNVVLYDLCLSMDYLDLLLYKLKDTNVIPLFNKDDLEKIELEVDGLSVEREFLINIYKCIRGIYSKQNKKLKITDILNVLSTRHSLITNVFKLKSALDIFSDMGFIDYNMSEYLLSVNVFPNPEKKSVEDNSIYLKLKNIRDNWIHMKEDLNVL